MIKRISFTIHGEVQGVSFRYFTQKKATSYGVTGWIQNTSTGEVEGEAQGTEEEIEKLVSDMNRGPLHAVVERLDKSDIEVQEGGSSFDVRR
ncbi:hypothetical protein B7494_g7928 [Chlorociboria aeruginascens]|nr:hypothetical protein B7494_g7928 [Chlorociboria aeruginascens]